MLVGLSSKSALGRECVCPEEADSRRSLVEANVAFAGSVDRIFEVSMGGVGRRFVLVRVARVWRGRLLSMHVLIVDVKGWCEPAYVAGQEYVWFGIDTPDGLAYDRCTGTRLDLGVTQLLGTGSQPIWIGWPVVIVAAFLLGAAWGWWLRLKTRTASGPSRPRDV